MSDARTTAIVDLAGFTALTEVHGDHAAIDLVEAFTHAARRAVAATGAELVKTIGGRRHARRLRRCGRAFTPSRVFSRTPTPPMRSPSLGPGCTTGQ